ncbi:FMN-binding protein [Arthrobacter woluwensis]|uniref:FMN-binding protein n=1 Tax=Arthrobacter woluwensis TaxID=156980 RepID=UPI0021BCFFFD|nr:FMN-binding protein [Arthrobacter woluwensis]
MSGTYTGSVISTRYGNVQVQVVLAQGKITDVIALQLTDQDGRSQQISSMAAPILRQEVLAAQSASVDSVSGATYTSEGYLQSLQAALDQAQ